MEHLTAADIMSSPVRTVPEGTTLSEAAEAMLEEGIGALPVVDADGRVVGIVTDSDFGSAEGAVPFSTFRAPRLLGRWVGEEGVERIYREARQRTVVEIMSSPVHTVESDAPLRELLDLMMKRDVKHVPVMDGNVAVGMVARHDLLKVVHRQLTS